MDWRLDRYATKGIFKNTAIDILACIFDPRDHKKEERNCFEDLSLPGPLEGDKLQGYIS